MLIAANDAKDTFKRDAEVKLGIKPGTFEGVIGSDGGDNGSDDDIDGDDGDDGDGAEEKAAATLMTMSHEDQDQVQDPEEAAELRKLFATGGRDEVIRTLGDVSYLKCKGLMMPVNGDDSDVARDADGHCLYNRCDPHCELYSSKRSLLHPNVETRRLPHMITRPPPKRPARG
jgi:hypothetical protein